MPFLEFQCPQGHITEKFFKSIREGAATQEIECKDCITGSVTGYFDAPVMAKKIISAPLGFGLYGDPAGYDKPSALKRHSTKLVSVQGNGASA